MLIITTHFQLYCVKFRGFIISF